ncbi:hypothetical protein N9W34_06220 [Rickettsiales bacterium]|nr:hypothetical protein [Rickettsiales bacterium]
MLHDPTFWVGLSSVIFFALVAKPVAKIVSSALDNRAADIQRELDEALRLKEEAQALLASYQKKQKDAKATADDIIKNAQEQVAIIREKSKKDLEELINKRVDMAMQKIAGYEATVLHEVRSNAVDIAIGTVRALVVENIGKDSEDELVNLAISDIDKKLIN